MKLDFENEPIENGNLYEHFSKEDKNFIEIEIKKLFSKGIIGKCEHEIGEYIWQIFIWLKLDSSNRLILNMKKVNHELPYINFKMETLQSVLELIGPGCLESVALIEAY